MKVGDWVHPKYPTVKIIDYNQENYNFLMTGDASMTATRHLKNKRYGASGYSADQFLFPITGYPFEVNIDRMVYLSPQYTPKQDTDGTIFHKKVNNKRCKVVLPKTFAENGEYLLVCQDSGEVHSRQAEYGIAEDVTDYAMSYVDTSWESSHFVGIITRAFDITTRHYYEDEIPPHPVANTMCVVTLPNYVQWWVNSYHLKLRNNA